MEKLDLFHSLGEVDDDILADAETFLRRTPGKRHALAWVKWGSLAACAALAVCAVWFTTRTPVHTTDPRASEELLPSASQPAAPSLEVTQGGPTVDRPAVEPAEETARSFAKLNPNKLTEEPQTVCGMFDLMSEDFVPMTREELLDYYGVALPVEELFPALSAAGPEEGDGFGRGIYQTGERGVYFDTNTFAFTGAGGGQAVNIALDKVFHLPFSPWELPGDELRFTVVNGWELALFCYVDGEGNLYYYTEFCQTGVNFRVTGKNMGELEFAALLEALLEPRSDYAPGAVRTVTGTYTGGLSRQTLGETQPDGSVRTQVTYGGVLGLTLEDGSGLLVALTPAQAEELYASLSLGGRVAVSFAGEPATVGTVWTQQLVSVSVLDA